MRLHARITALGLILALLAACFGSCAGGGDKQKQANNTQQPDSTASTGTVSDEPDLPRPDYEGASFDLLIRKNVTYDEIHVYSDGLTGEVVNDAVYNRNKVVEDRYNITINAIFEENVAEAAKRMILAGDDKFDVMWDSKNQLASLASQGLCADLNELGYADFTAPYWDKNAFEQLSIAGRLYMMPSDISMNNLNGVRFLYFNKGLIESYSLPDPYELVDKNEWTLDNFLGMVKSVSKDLNGDGVMDASDQFGMLTEDSSDNGNIMYFVTGSGIKNTTNDNEGIPRMSFMGDKIVDVIDKVKAVMTDKTCVLNYQEVAKGQDTSKYPHIFDFGRSVFASDHFLFIQGGTGLAVQFSNMASDYGIVPNPKYDSNQEKYYHRLDPYNTMLAVPITNSEMERTGLILEYMSYLSGKTVLPAYYDTTIKIKRMRDEVAPKMLDIIKGSICYELSDIFDFGISGIIYNGYVSGNIMSTFEKQENRVIKSIDTLVEKITQE